MLETTASSGSTQHRTSAGVTMTRRHPKRAARAPASGIATIEPMPRHSSSRPSTPSSTPVRALANGTSGAQAAMAKPAMKNTMRVEVCWRRPGAGRV